MDGTAQVLESSWLFTRHMYRELAWKWSGRDSNWRPYEMLISQVVAYPTAPQLQPLCI